MFYVDGNDIYLTRGDTMILNVTITKDGSSYTPASGDTIRFAMKNRYEDSDADVLINKNIDMSTMQLTLLPSDTKNLKMGRSYVYDIEFVDASGNVDTFIKGNFYLGEEVL